MRLSYEDGSRVSIADRMLPFQCAATVLLIGPRVAAVVKDALEAISTRQSEKISLSDDLCVQPPECVCTAIHR